MWSALVVGLAGLMWAEGPEERGLGYLGREAPRWRAEHRCASCHHNGDAARVLMWGGKVRESALRDSLDWLSQPAGWDKNGGEGPFSDKGLARLQFSAALVAAIQTKRIEDKEGKILMVAAEGLVKDQGADGAWRYPGGDELGGPTTYGAALSTVMACQVLKQVPASKFAKEIERAQQWLIQAKVARVTDAAAALWGLATVEDPRARIQKQKCLDVFKRGQSANGGWGPYVNSGPEVFDTALVILALCALPNDSPQRKSQVELGRSYLIKNQLEDGSWDETTRPSGGASLAQRLSTSAWATYALGVSSGYLK